MELSKERHGTSRSLVGSQSSRSNNAKLLGERVACEGGSEVKSAYEDFAFFKRIGSDMNWPADIYYYHIVSHRLGRLQLQIAILSFGNAATDQDPAARDRNVNRLRLAKSTGSPQELENVCAQVLYQHESEAILDLPVDCSHYFASEYSGIDQGVAAVLVVFSLFFLRFSKPASSAKYLEDVTGPMKRCKGNFESVV